MLRDYLRKQPKNTTMIGPLSNEHIVQAMRSTPQPNRSTTQPKMALVNVAPTETDTSMTTYPHQRRSPTWMTQALLLVTPLLLHLLLSKVGFREMAFPVFIAMAFVAVRHVVLLHLPISEDEIYHDSSLPCLVTCRFLVDLKGINRFIRNTQEDKESSNRRPPADADVKAIHLVVRAITRALAHERSLRRLRVSYPWLLIDKWVDIPSIQMSIISDDCPVITLDRVETLSIQDVSNIMTRKLSETDLWTAIGDPLGNCIIFVPPSTDESHTGDMDVMMGSPSNVLLHAVLGNSIVKGDRSHLPVTLTISAPTSHHVTSCHRLASEVEKLLQYPEMMCY